MLLCEQWLPARQRNEKALSHNIDNLALGIIGSLLLRLIPGILAAHLAIENETWEVGLSFILGVPAESIALIVIAIITLDFSIYWQHRYFHYNRYLWKLHRVHHSDKTLNSTSALRFHPIEIVVSMLIKSILVLSLGLPFISVVLFEILLNACAIFNHTNIRLPKTLERQVRCLIVTPSMHRIHHSLERMDSDSNFGFCLSVWDHMFGTYSRINQSGQKGFEMGVKELKNHKAKGIRNLLIQPFER